MGFKGDLNEILVRHTYPSAYVAKTKGAVDIRRPRTAEDTPALVQYVLLSGYHMTNLMAWDDAAARIINDHHKHSTDTHTTTRH